ncbi:hypothetical protein C1645_750533 [Glomus cerebriforme]|uniref:Uncharacterized protein n=1 Tax=Glomus cerebriforme TaxID=658196 RepID=A0A397TLF3_9GLOM|nr:hypothetical protein C1645_750533 [Glomus cerebriforme]
MFIFVIFNMFLIDCFFNPIIPIIYIFNILHFIINNCFLIINTGSNVVFITIFQIIHS